MLTNRINVTYNMENIDADFDVFRVEKANKDYYKYNILDSAVYEFKAAAVQWTFGATALVLFRKGEVTEQQFKESIMKEYEDVKIQKIDLFDSEQCSNCFYFENRLLAQLLINSMRTPKHEAFMYNNLTGKLFYHDPSWKHKDKLTGKVNFIRFLEIVIDPGMYLNLEHKTFKRYDRESNGLYVIDSKTGEFRKKLKTDTNVITYKEGSLPHNHFRVDNFDITDITHFRKSKMGVMEQFLRDVNDNLSKYISIDIVEREDAQQFDISNLEKKGISELEYGEMLQKKGVVIVDENDSEISKDIVAKLQEELEKYYHVKAAVGNLSGDAYNIRIIHDGEYYAENEMHDPHSDNLKGYIVQHITEEAEHFTNTKGSSPDIKKIVQELIIKGDVRERMISIFDWKRLDSGKDWTFVLRKKIKTKFGENVEHMNFGNKKAFNYYNYYRLKIDGNGKMEFDAFCDSNQSETEEWNKICYTKKTGPTDNIDKSGKSKDLYASFRTPDNKRTATHILFEVNKIRVNTNDSIAFSSYFSNYEIHDNTNDGSYRNKYFNIAYDVDEFKYVMAYFLKYDLNWLDREYKEIEAVNKVDFQESVISEQNKIVQKHLNNIASIIEKEIEQVPVYGEEKKALTKIRINQSVFRELLLKRYSSCCLCNVNDKNFLVASHIKPWAKSNSEEKLDVNNGLLLCPNHDRLFDKGYISFDNDGRILISNNLSHNNLIYMNIRENMKINITDEAKKYMKYHRENIFID